MQQPRTWQVRRTGVPLATGQQRWDRAYQLLLQWAAATPSPPAETPALSIVLETSHAHSDLQPRFDQSSGRAPNH
jgi:uncharacterized protein (UPF0548 family)